MYNNKIFKISLLFLITSTSLLFSTEYGKKKFDIETAMVLFKISGKAQITDDINLTINGHGKLRFKNGGVVTLLEESYTEVTKGNINNINKIKIVKKFENNKRYDVDFINKKILERPMPKGSFRDNILKGLTKGGKENIAGVECDVWEAEGVKKCIYKGIPLLVEHYVLGNYYQKKAIEIKTDLKPSPTKCKLPDFPIEKFALFTTNMKTKTVKLPTELSELIIHILDKIKKDKIILDKITAPKKRDLLNILGENIYKKQYNLLPKYLKTMKETRVCLAQSNDKNKFKTCLTPLTLIEQKMKLTSDYNIDSWNLKAQDNISNLIDDNIFTLQSKMKCIRGSKNIFDLSNCMK